MTKRKATKRTKGYLPAQAGERAKVAPRPAPVEEPNHWRQEVLDANDDVRAAARALEDAQVQANAAKAAARIAKKSLAEATKYLSDVVAGTAQPKLPFGRDADSAVGDEVESTAGTKWTEMLGKKT